MSRSALTARHAAVEAAPASELAFLDTSLSDWPVLRAGLPGHVAVILLDPLHDGLAAMAHAAGQHRDLAAIHVFSHGFEGALLLGNLVLDAEGLAGRTRDLATLGASLADSGSILLYGCNVAAGQGGQFLDLFAEATGASVAASRTPTGAGGLGGIGISAGTLAMSPSSRGG